MSENQSLNINVNNVDHNSGKYSTPLKSDIKNWYQYKSTKPLCTENASVERALYCHKLSRSQQASQPY